MERVTFLASQPVVITKKRHGDAKPYSSHSVVQVEQTAPRREEMLRIAGKLAWTALHSYKGCDRHWLTLWTRLIPDYCECSAGYRDILKKRPPNFSSPTDFFMWGCDVHNLVSAKLKKETWSRDRMLHHWTPRRDSKFGIHCPLIYGGLERWAISLSGRCFGIAPVNSMSDAAEDIVADLSKHNIELTTIPEMSFSNKVILVSNSPGFKKPIGATAVLVAHGYCEYTRNWVEKCHSECDYLVGVSKEVSSKLESWTGRPSFVIENGADVSRLSRPKVSASEFKMAYGVPVDSKILAYAGRLTNEKGVDRLIEVAARIPDDHFLFIMGWGERDRYYSLACQNGAEGKVFFLPPTEDQASLLNAADVFISLPESEGFGLAVTEAMLLGKRVVHTSTGIIKQMKEEFGNFGPLVVDPGDSPIEIARGIHRSRPVHSSLLSRFTHESFLDRWDRFVSSVRPEVA